MNQLDENGFTFSISEHVLLAIKEIKRLNPFFLMIILYISVQYMQYIFLNLRLLKINVIMGKTLKRGLYLFFARIAFFQQLESLYTVQYIILY
jgi:hypothetical protein